MKVDSHVYWNTRLHQEMTEVFATENYCKFYSTVVIIYKILPFAKLNEKQDKAINTFIYHNN